MITYIIQVAICWGLFLALYHYSLRKETFFNINRTYLLLTLTLGLVIPRLTWDISMFMKQAPIEAMVEYMTISFDQISWALSGDNNQQSISIFSIIYWIGVCFMLTKLMLGIAKIMWMHYKAHLDHSGQYTIAHTSSNHAPFTFFGTIYLSPLNNNPIDNKEILIHEAAHVSGWHTVDVLFIEMLKVFFWFNPLIYGYEHALKNVHEYIADANVLRQTALQKYGRLLLRTAQPGLEVALANHFYNHQLKQRFKMMSRTPSQKRMLVKYLSVLPFILIISLVFTNQNVQARIDKNIQNEINKYSESIATDTLPVSPEIFKAVEQMPVFPGGQEELLSEIFKNMNYPKTAKDAGVEGMNVVSFIIEVDGSMSNIKLLRNAGSGLGEESLRVVKLIADNYNWTPGIQRGKKVRVMMNLPIKFKLEGDVKIEEEQSQNIIRQTNQNTAIQKEPNGKQYLVDTIITFYPATFEEQIQIIRTELNGKTPSHYNTKLKIFDQENFNIDTIVTYDPEKLEETIQIVRTPKEEIFKIVEQMPRFPGCEDQSISDSAKFNCGNKKLIEFIVQHIKYPKTSMENETEGMAVVRFTVEKNGTLSDIKVIKSPDKALGEAAMQIVQLMNEKAIKWIPGVQRGRIVRVLYTLPISFKLPTNDIKPNNTNSTNSTNSTKPLIVIYDKKGKEVLRGKVNLSENLKEDLDPINIKSINVLKGESAENTFGDAGSDGVIQIYLKNNTVVRPKKLRNKTMAPQIEVGVEGVLIFPNPTSDMLNIHVDKVLADANLTIYTMFGQVLHQRKLSKSNSLQTLEIDISRYPSGAMLVAIHNKNKLFSSMVIKQ